MRLRLCLALLLVLVFSASGLKADEAATTSSTTNGRQSRIWDVFGYEDEAGNHHHVEGGFLDWFHNPAKGIEQGLDLRLRSIWADRITTLDKTDDSRYEFQRYRTRLWHKLMLDKDVDVNIRWVWEFRTWDKPDSKPSDVDFDEIILDRLNITARNMFDMPLTMVLGRQDIILGGGWLVLDGTPLDGSRTIYFDAARFTFDIPEQDSKLDLIGIYQSANSKWLPPISDNSAFVTEQDETGFIAWLTNNSIENTTLEGFYIYKNDNPVNDSVPNNFPGAWSRKAEIHTLGGAISGKLDDNWSYRGDAAVQFGDRAERSSSMDGKMRNLNAYGAKGMLKYAFNDSLSNELHATYEFLSGNDPDSKNDEAFDPLWGEWPQWSELLTYTYSKEGAIGETTNLSRLNFGHSFKPAKKVTFTTDYHLLWANEPGSGSALVGGNDMFRGQLYALWLKYQCCAKLNAHTVFEYFVPGNYYSSTENAFFLRFNLEYSF